MRYPIILLDVDDTLLDFQAAEACALRDTLTARNIPATDENVALYSRVNRSWWEKFERGECEKSALLWLRFEEFFSRLGVAFDPHAAQHEYHENLGNYAFLIPGAEALCRELKARGHKLYVVTNGTAHIQHRRFGASGLEAYMDGVFISEEMGTQKPAPEFFEKVFAALEWPDKENCIILGDSQSSDMLGGKNAGITTCWYNPKGEIKKGDWAFEIRSLEQFLEVVS